MHVALVQERRYVYIILLGKPEERDHLENPGVDGIIILRLIFRKSDVIVWTRSSWLMIETVVGNL